MIQCDGRNLKCWLVCVPHVCVHVVSCVCRSCVRAHHSCVSFLCSSCVYTHVAWLLCLVRVQVRAVALLTQLLHSCCATLVQLSSHGWFEWVDVESNRIFCQMFVFHLPRVKLEKLRLPLRIGSIFFPPPTRRRAQNCGKWKKKKLVLN